MDSYGEQEFNKVFSLYDYRGMLCLHSSNESVRVGLLWLRFETPSGRVARLDFKPVRIMGKNFLYALDNITFEEEQKEQSGEVDEKE